jgi:predicted transcriptional regulator
MKRLPMRKIREALRLRSKGLSTREIAASLGVGQTTVSEYLKRATRAGLVWPLPEALTDASREAMLSQCTAHLVGGRRSERRV